MRNDNDRDESDNRDKEVAEAEAKAHSDAEGKVENADDCSIPMQEAKEGESKGNVCNLDPTDLSGRYGAGQGDKCVKAPGTRGEVKLRWS